MRDAILLPVVVILCFWLRPAAGTIVTTKHNLSASGPGPVRAAEEAEICVFCHVSHNASPTGPLWNRPDPGRNYTPYSSSTAVALPGQPTGASLLCLSCHDGTIALGDVLSRATAISMAGGASIIPAGPGRLGTDLSDDHPVSFVYSAALASERGELVPPATLTGPVRLDSSGQLQCTACHDPHENRFGKFLVMPNTGSALCRTCHQKNFWNQSAHSLSTNTWNGVPPDPWPFTAENDVASNGCENCHASHSAGGRQRLLNFEAEEDNCIACHNGNVASKDVASDFDKFSQHPVRDTSGVHDPDEPAVIRTRHVECVDCHDPHAARSGPGSLPGPLTGVRGVRITGTEADPASFAYEICFRCHADSTNKPPPLTARQIGQTNVRLEFSTTNPSYHPVAGPGRNPDVPSLIAPLTINSTIDCIDCHNSDTASGIGGLGPNGPHGSQFPPILERPYETLDDTPESFAAYALCYKCHDQSRILGDQSFSGHDLHVREERTPCNVCHDPHGISSTQGNAINSSKLINFDISVVSPNSAGLLRFESTGRFRGACYLSCHGVDHAPETYPP